MYFTFHQCGANCAVDQPVFHTRHFSFYLTNPFPSIKSTPFVLNIYSNLSLLKRNTKNIIIRHEELFECSVLIYNALRSSWHCSWETRGRSKARVAATAKNEECIVCDWKWNQSLYSCMCVRATSFLWFFTRLVKASPFIYYPFFASAFSQGHVVSEGCIYGDANELKAKNHQRSLSNKNLLAQRSSR